MLMAATHHLLTPVNVFMLMAFMNFLRVTVSYYIGYGLQFVFDAWVSLARIQNFLMLTTLPHLRENPEEEDMWSQQARVTAIPLGSCGSSTSKYVTDASKHKDDSTG